MSRLTVRQNGLCSHQLDALHVASGGYGRVALTDTLEFRRDAMRQAFGNCVFDRDRRQLTKEGVPVHGAPKLLALLELPLDAAPRALTALLDGARIVLGATVLTFRVFDSQASTTTVSQTIG